MPNQTTAQQMAVVARVKGFRAGGFDLYLFPVSTAVWILPVCNQ